MEKITSTKVRKSKVQGQKISMLTAYDYPFAKILDEAGVDIILVGDSLGNVVLGHKNTRPVTMEDMAHHTRAAARGIKMALLVADLPYKAISLSNARRLGKAGAEAVKVEGIQELGEIEKMIKAGIPVMGHLGYLPQKDRKPAIKRSKKIIKEAKILERAGVFAIVLEMVAPELAKEVTDAVKVPTIGIGSGRDCDGQVLVTYDLLGLSDWSPKFAPRYLDLKRQITEAVKRFIKNCAPVAQLERASVS